MKPMMKVIQSAYIEQKDWENVLQDFLFSHRLTQHSSTKPPADVTYLRHNRHSLPDIFNKINLKSIQRTLQQNDSQQKNVDLKKSLINIGDRILVKKLCQNNLSPLFQPYPCQIISKKGAMLTGRHMSTNQEIIRNQTHFKSIPETVIVSKKEQVKYEF